MLADWIDEDDSQRLNGAESDDYLREYPGYRAANAHLQSLEELRLLKVWQDEFFDQAGNPNERFAQLASLVSVMHTGAVNLNAAPEEVLEVLALQDGWQDDFLFDGLDQPYLKSPPDRATASSGVEVGLLRVTVSLKRGNVTFTISALVEPKFSETSASSSTNSSASGSASYAAPKTGTI